MIINILANLVFWLVDIVCFFLPNWKLPDFIFDGVNMLMPPVVMIVKAFPFMHAVFTCFLLMIGFKIGLMIANVVFGFLGLIRGSGTPRV